MNYEVLKVDHYNEIYSLWIRTPGIGIRNLDDSREGIEKFLKRNPNTNFVCIDGDKIVGAILCGHDGRRAYIYHTCVDESYRKLGIAKCLVTKVSQALRKEDINKISLVCYKTNEVGNNFWNKINYEKREDLNYYNLSLNKDNY